MFVVVVDVVAKTTDRERDAVIMSDHRIDRIKVLKTLFLFKGNKDICIQGVSINILSNFRRVLGAWEEAKI